MRTVSVKRATKETDIEISLNLDGAGKCSVSTGIGFFDHMLQAFAVHGGFDLEVKAKGDLEVDGHHTVEDTGIVLGEAFEKALADKGGIARYGLSFIPMDEALARCVVDISARPFLVAEGLESCGMIGGYDSALTVEFLRAFVFHAGITLHLSVLYGENAHHKAEAAFKALGHAMKMACARTGGPVLSTKGSLS